MKNLSAETASSCSMPDMRPLAEMARAAGDRTKTTSAETAQEAVFRLRVLLTDHERRLQHAYARLLDMHALQARVEHAERQAATLQREVDARYAELAALTQWMEARQYRQVRIASSSERSKRRNWIGSRLLRRLARRVRDELRLHAGMREAQRVGESDATWYLRKYPDVAQSGMNPLEHYVRHGAGEGRERGPVAETARRSVTDPLPEARSGTTT